MSEAITGTNTRAYLSTLAALPKHIATRAIRAGGYARWGLTRRRINAQRYAGTSIRESAHHALRLSPNILSGLAAAIRRDGTA